MNEQLIEKFNQYVIKNDLVDFVNSIYNLKSCQLNSTEKCYNSYCIECYGSDLRKCNICNNKCTLADMIIDDIQDTVCYKCQNKCQD